MSDAPTITFDPSFSKHAAEDQRIVRGVLSRLSADVERVRTEMLDGGKARDHVLVVSTALTLAELAELADGLDELPAPAPLLAVVFVCAAAAWAQLGESIARKRPTFAEAIEARRAARADDQVVLVLCVGTVEFVGRIDRIESSAVFTARGGDA